MPDIPVARMRAALRLLDHGDITPMGRRLLTKIIDEYDTPAPKPRFPLDNGSARNGGPEAST